MNRLRLVFAPLAFVPAIFAAAPIPRHLPGELSADEILNGVYAFPPSPSVQVTSDLAGFAPSRISKVPAPGVHPRILISPEDLPDLRRRLKETNVGRALYATLQTRLDSTIRNPKDWGSELYARLSIGDVAGANSLILAHKGLPPAIGHYQPYLYAFVLEAFDALITDDLARGRKVATAIATYAALIRPSLERSLALPMGDDVWRAKTSGPTTGTGISDQGLRDGVGGHLLGYGYDFAHAYMTEAQRATVRGVIAQATFGKLWLGARLPHHFRNWNWVAVGLQQPLLALAIEGEEGFDARVYRLGVEIARDYLTYGISPTGMSTEAVGYTQFGFVWANPFFVAAARRGDNLLVHGHHRAMVDWYLHTNEPGRDKWTSHGDGGDGTPAIWTLSMWRYFFPRDPKIETVWHSLVKSAPGRRPFIGNFHLIEPLLWADADPALEDIAIGESNDPAALRLPMTLFDPERSSLITRSAWTPDAAMLQFECRTDSVGASHEHADRGAFTFSALGRSWANDYFRSVETRHHNGILIDGLGQGYWPGPGNWLGLQDDGRLLIAACDMKPAYDWFWPKQILTENPDTFTRFAFARWDSYRGEARDFQAEHAAAEGERDPRPGVVKFWQGFERTDPRLWDEDSWPVRFPHNPVQRAYRTVVFARAPQPYALIVDDVQKDDQERLYEWLMQTGPDTAVVSLNGNDIVLCDATVQRDEAGRAQPSKGDRMLLVRALGLNEPRAARDYPSRPSIRLEEFERRDTLMPEAANGALSGARSFGLDKRLVIPSRSAAPDFKILLFPFRSGAPLPVTAWNADRSRLTLTCGTHAEELNFTQDAHGRTLITAGAAAQAPPSP